MTFEILLALMLFTLVSSMTPGPNNIMLMNSGATFGLKRSLPHMFGVGSGFTLMVALVGMGVMTIFDTIPSSYLVLRYLSMAYLIYLAYKIAVSSAPDSKLASASPFTFVQAAAFQWVNPKAWTMALTAISVYAPDRTIGAVFIVAGAFALASVASCSSWVIVGQSLQKWLSVPKRLRLFNITMAVFLVGSLIPVLMNPA